LAAASNGLEDLIFGDDFGGISDLKLGPGRYLCVVSIRFGKIFRIVPDYK
jgi:hypothetical protein